MSRDNLEAGEPWPTTFGRPTAEGPGEAEREEVPVSDTTRLMPVLLLALAAASVARRFASMSLAAVGRASMTDCRVRVSPCSCRSL